MILQRYDEYNESHCWQYDIRLKNRQQDLDEHNLTEEYVNNLKVSDFEFRNVVDKTEHKRMSDFIKRHEWLGNLSQYTTHWFGCYHKDILSGVILFNVPNSFSKILGEDTPNLERLISRGACISWSPKNLASALLMWSVKWMVDNTNYRLFTAYSDPSANELGTIYQACNFFYMGKSSGAVKRYINPYTNKPVSDRFFRQKTAYKKYAKVLGIDWQKDWNHKTGMNWYLIPDDIEKKLRDYSKKVQSSSEVIEIPSKHKYAYVLGRTKNETKWLRKRFEGNNKTYPYPKERGK
jgi:hypothetical protein